MRVLLYGDLQVQTKKKDYTRFLDATLEYLLQVIYEEQPDLVVNLGDVLHTFGTIEVEDLLFAYRWMARIGNVVPRFQASIPGYDGRRHWIIKGNHDLSDRAGDHASIEVMESTNTRVFLQQENAGFMDRMFGVLPYSESPPDLESLSMGYNGFFGHVEWVGAHATPTFISKDGLQPHIFAKKYPNAPVFNGHYHTPAQLGPVTLVGSPLHMDFNDVLTSVPRGFTIWDTNTGDGNDIRRIPNPHTYHCLEATLPDKDTIQDFYQQMYPQRARLKIKIYVPLALEEYAQDLFHKENGFLWISVAPSESRRTGIEHMEGIQLSSTPAEIISKVRETATDDLDVEMLETFAMEAFK